MSQEDYLSDSVDATNVIDLVETIRWDMINALDGVDLSPLPPVDVQNWIAWRECVTETVNVIAQSIHRIDAIKEATDYQGDLGDITFARKRFKSTIEDSCADLAGWYEDLCYDLKKKARAKISRYLANSWKHK